MIKGLVAIVGRPNVGKSTLFNLMTKSQSAIVNDRPGVTRDRIYGSCFYDDDKTSGFLLIDTGGFETPDMNLQPFKENLVWRQTSYAIEEADLVLLLLDAKDGVQQHDKEIALYLKAKGKKVLFVINKIDGVEQAMFGWEFFALGDVDFHKISAAHNRGVRDLVDAIQDHFKHVHASKQVSLHDEYATKVAIIGRPNVGKSSILNRLVGSERSLVSDVAGTTRDSLDTPFTYNGKPYLLIDTAGVRRRSKIFEELEIQSVVRSLRAIERADIVVHVISAIDGLTDQDARLVNLAIERHIPTLIVVNKWDLIPDKVSNSARDYASTINSVLLKDRSFIPVHFTSCLTNQRVHKIMHQIEMISEQYKRKIPTSLVNQALAKMVIQHSPQLVKRYAKRIKFYYATQVKSAPPTFVVMCNVADDIQEGYKRYMVNFLREEFHFDHVPIRMILRAKKEAQSRRASKKEDASAMML